MRGSLEPGSSLRLFLGNVVLVAGPALVVWAMWICAR